MLDFKYRVTWYWEGQERSSIDMNDSKDVTALVKEEEREGFQIRVMDLEKGRVIYESEGLGNTVVN